MATTTHVFVHRITLPEGVQMIPDEVITGQVQNLVEEHLSDEGMPGAEYGLQLQASYDEI